MFTIDIIVTILQSIIYIFGWVDPYMNLQSIDLSFNELTGIDPRQSLSKQTF